MMDLAAITQEIEALRRAMESSLSPAEVSFISGAIRFGEWLTGEVDRPPSADLDK